MMLLQDHRIKLNSTVWAFLTPPQPSPLTGREHDLRVRKSPLLAGEI
jgi:hypothetical protein